MIKSIQVMNVRGIGDKTFVFDQPEMHPNKVHLLIASNGFGKSSLATAFGSLNSRRLTLKDNEFHQHDEARPAKLVVSIHDGVIGTNLYADQSQNEIGKIFDIFVIRGPRRVKATQRPTQSGFQVAVGEFVIDPIELCNIPDKQGIHYKYRESASLLEGAGRAAPNIASELRQSSIIEGFLTSKFGERQLGVKLSSKYNELLTSIRRLSGTADEVIAELESRYWPKLENMPELLVLCDQFSGLGSKAKAILAAIQLVEACRIDLRITKQAKEWHCYEENLARIKDLLKSCNPNPGWINVDVKQSSGKLLICLPKPDFMSNGQRDFLCFMAQLLEFQFSSKKKDAILLIDEVFDYLDYANILACQYFLMKFIDEFASAKKRLYPLILTHLDPSVFNSFVFNKKIQKNHYLDRVTPTSALGGLCKMIRQRAIDPDFENVFANYHAHHSLLDCDEKDMFEQKSLKRNWGCSRTFKEYCREQISFYLGDYTGEIDYLAVCLGLRVHIEKNACDQLAPDLQRDFIIKKRTVEKLEFAIEKGASVPEVHFLLASLYNSALHSGQSDQDFLTPVVTKLQNSCIRQMVWEAINWQSE